MKSEDSNLDLAFAVLFAIVLVVVTIYGWNQAHGFIGRILFLGFVGWLWSGYGSGFGKIEVGSRGQGLWFGGRIPFFKGEGLYWLPKPFGIKKADCREKVVKLDGVGVTTKDNVRLEIKESSLFWRISNLDLFFSVDEKALKGGLDDMWDQTLRLIVREQYLEDALSLQIETKKTAEQTIREHADVNWGVDVLRMRIPELKAPEEVRKDLELKERENLQREGQIVELDHFRDRVNSLMKAAPEGAGLSLAQAIEQVQMTLGKATKNIDAKTIALDPATATIIGNALAGRK